jgi:hypothetical protein
MTMAVVNPAMSVTAMTLRLSGRHCPSQNEDGDKKH